MKNTTDRTQKLLPINIFSIFSLILWIIFTIDWRVIQAAPALPMHPGSNSQNDSCLDHTNDQAEFIVFVDVERFESELALHEFFARELNFPAYYGKNLDALEEVLIDCYNTRKLKIVWVKPTIVDNVSQQQLSKWQQLFFDFWANNRNFTMIYL